LLFRLSRAQPFNESTAYTINVLSKLLVTEPPFVESFLLSFFAKSFHRVFLLSYFLATVTASFDLKISQALCFIGSLAALYFYFLFPLSISAVYIRFLPFIFEWVL